MKTEEQLMEGIETTLGKHGLVEVRKAPSGTKLDAKQLNQAASIAMTAVMRHMGLPVWDKHDIKNGFYDVLKAIYEDVEPEGEPLDEKMGETQIVRRIMGAAQEVIADELFSQPVYKMRLDNPTYRKWYEGLQAVIERHAKEMVKAAKSVGTTVGMK